MSLEGPQCELLRDGASLRAGPAVWALGLRAALAGVPESQPLLLPVL